MFNRSSFILAALSRGMSFNLASEQADLMAAAERSWHVASWRGQKQYPYRLGNSLAGKPHANKRAIARRQRQADRDYARREDRAARAGRGDLLAQGMGLSRRGLPCPLHG